MRSIHNSVDWIKFGIGLKSRTITGSEIYNQFDQIWYLSEKPLYDVSRQQPVCFETFYNDPEISRDREDGT